VLVLGKDEAISRGERGGKGEKEGGVRERERKGGRRNYNYIDMDDRV
jgi:hypothetical protein